MRKLILKTMVFLVPFLLMVTGTQIDAAIVTSLSSAGYTTSELDTYSAPTGYHVIDWDDLKANPNNYTDLKSTLSSNSLVFVQKNVSWKTRYQYYFITSSDTVNMGDIDSFTLSDGTLISLGDTNFFSTATKKILLGQETTATPEPETYATLLVIFGIGALMYRRQKKGSLQGLA